MIDMPGDALVDEDGRTADPSGFVVAQPLDAATFAPFGEVIAHDGRPARTTMELAFAAEDGTSPRLWVNRVATAASPIRAKTFEQHPFSAQNFLPLRGGRWLVVVTESGPDGRPRGDRMRAFITSKHQGITYRPGVWHHGLMALDDDAEVAVVMCLTGRDDDTELADLALPRSIEVSRNED